MTGRDDERLLLLLKEIAVGVFTLAATAAKVDDLPKTVSAYLDRLQVALK